MVKDFRFVFLHPRQFGCREVAGRVEQMLETVIISEVVEGTFSKGDGTGVAPDDGIAQGFEFFVHDHEAMHLIRDTDSFDVFSFCTCLSHDLL